MNNKYIISGVSTIGTLGIASLIVGTQLSSNTEEDTPKDSVEIDNTPVVPPANKSYDGAMSDSTKRGFVDSSLASKFSAYLLDTDNDAKGQGTIKQKQLSTASPQSGLFKSAKSTNTVDKLKTVCKQMFAYPQNQGDKLGSSSAVGPEAHRTLGQETGEYCAAAPTNDMPSTGPSKTIK